MGSFEREATRVEEALNAPRAATLLERGAATRDGIRIKQAWRVLVAGEWPAYAAAVEAAIVPTYSCTLEARSLSCSQWMPGDLVQLRLSTEAHAEGLAIRAELQASPD